MPSCRDLSQGASDLFVNVHLGTELHSFIVVNLGNRITVTCDLRLESAHFTRQSAVSRIKQGLLDGAVFYGCFPVKPIRRLMASTPSAGPMARVASVIGQPTASATQGVI